MSVRGLEIYLRNDSAGPIVMGTLSIPASSSAIIWDSINYTDGTTDNFEQVLAGIATFNQEIGDGYLVMVVNTVDKSPAEAFTQFSELVVAFQEAAIKDRFSILRLESESVHGLSGIATSLIPGLFDPDGYTKLSNLDDVAINAHLASLANPHQTSYSNLNGYIEDGYSGSSNSNLVLKPDGYGGVTWGVGGGDVTGPGTHGDDVLPVFEGVDTNILRTTGITINGSDEIDGVAQLDFAGATATTGDINLPDNGQIYSYGDGYERRLLKLTGGTLYIGSATTGSLTSVDFEADSTYIFRIGSTILQMTPTEIDFQVNLNMNNNNIITGSGTVDGRDVSADGAALDAHLVDYDNPHQTSYTNLSGYIEDGYTESVNTALVLKPDGYGGVLWGSATAGGGGDVIGPGIHGDNILPRFDGINTNVLQTSGITIDDGDNITGAGTYNGVNVEGHVGSTSNPHQTSFGNLDGYIEDSATATIDTSKVLKPDGAGGVVWGDSGAVGLDGYLPLDGSQAMTGDLDMGTHSIVNVVDPINPQDAATKAYVDGYIDANNEWSEVLANGRESGSNNPAINANQAVEFYSPTADAYGGKNVPTTGDLRGANSLELYGRYHAIPSINISILRWLGSAYSMSLGDPATGRLYNIDYFVDNTGTGSTPGHNFYAGTSNPGLLVNIDKNSLSFGSDATAVITQASKTGDAATMTVSAQTSSSGGDGGDLELSSGAGIVDGYVIIQRGGVEVARWNEYNQLDVNGNRIVDVQDPINPQDAVTKNYVDGYIYDEISTLDHGSLLGLGDDDHTQYILVNGTRAFTGTVSGVTPTIASHLATKGYVDGYIASTNEWSEVLANGNTTGGTNPEISSGDHLQAEDGSDLTFYVSSGGNFVLDSDTDSVSLTAPPGTSIGIYGPENPVGDGKGVSIFGGGAADGYNAAGVSIIAGSCGGGSDTGNAGSVNLATGIGNATGNPGNITLYLWPAGTKDGYFFVKSNLVNQFSVSDGYISAHTNSIRHVQDPVEAQDAVTKNYVDGYFAGLEHGELLGLGDDDHTQYILVDGTRAFTGTVGGVTPTDATHLATKGYVDGYFFTYEPAITVRKNTGADVGTRPRLNFIEGANITLTVADDPGSDEIDITVATSGAVGEANTASNVGNATGEIYRDKVGVNFNFKTIDGYGGIGITNSADVVEIDGYALLPLDGSRSMTGDLDMGTNYITNVVDPVNPQDAATRAYVDGYTFQLPSHASTHENGGDDEIEISNLGTSETNTTYVLKPDGAGGVTWGPGGSSVDLDGYLPRDGSKPMTGDLDMDGYDILNAGEINGYRTYAASATDPSSPVPADGDRYFNTSLEMWMTYDGSRSKWLSEESAYIQFGRDGFTAVGSYFRGIDGQTLSDTIGYHAFWNGTIVGAAITIESSVTSDIQFTEGGTTRATLSLTASVSERDTTLDGDFSQGGILAVRNASTGNTVDNCSGWFRVKWRA